MKISDIAYTAGIIDGEGSISLAVHHGQATADGSRPRNSPMLLLQISMTDEAVIRWLADSWKCGHVVTLKPRKKHHLLAWSWRVYAGNAEGILLACLPYLKVKNKQAALTISYRKLVGAASIKIGEVEMRRRLKFRERMIALNKTESRVRTRLHASS